MIIEKEQKSSKFVGEASKTMEYQLTADADRQRQLMLVLRDSLYADPIGAVVRELLQNAADATLRHARLNNIDPLPIEITMPNRFGSQLIIRDYGTGMTPEIVQRCFLGYGNSDKDTSNQETGGFGVGSKAVYAYTDAIEVRTIVDGNYWEYYGVADSDGGGEFKEIETGQTDDLNGTTIEFAVSNHTDIDAFRRSIEWYGSWLSVPIKITNGAGLVTMVEKKNTRSFDVKVEENGVEKVFPCKFHYVRRLPNHLRSGSFIIMGGVPYPLNTQKVEEQLFGDKPKVMVKYRPDTQKRQLLRDTFGSNNQTRGYFIFEVPIGFGNPDLSRENLRYDKYGQFSNRVLALAATLAQDVGKQRKTMFDDCKTQWEAQVVARSQLNNGEGVFSRYNTLQMATFNGRSLAQISRPDFCQHLPMRCIDLRQRNFTYRCTTADQSWYSPQFTEQPLFVGVTSRRSYLFHQLFLHWRSRKGCEAFTADQVAKVFVRDFQGQFIYMREEGETLDQAKEKVLARIKTCGYEGMPLEMVDLDATYEAPTASGGASGVKRITSNVAQLKDWQTDRTSKSQSFRWEECEWEPTNGDVYTFMFGYLPTLTDARRERNAYARNVFSVLSFLEQQGVTIPNIYAVKPREMDKKESDLRDMMAAEAVIPLEEWILAQFELLVGERAELLAEAHLYDRSNLTDYKALKTYRKIQPDSWLNTVIDTLPDPANMSAKLKAEAAKIHTYQRDIRRATQALDQLELPNSKIKYDHNLVQGWLPRMMIEELFRKCVQEWRYYEVGKRLNSYYYKSIDDLSDARQAFNVMMRDNSKYEEYRKLFATIN